MAREVGGLEAALGRLGGSLAFPSPGDAQADVAARVAATLRPEAGHPPRGVVDPARWRRARALRPLLRPSWQPVAAALLALAVVAGGIVGFSPAARDAVASWLGIRGVRIHVQPTPPRATFPSPGPSGALGSNLDLGTVVTLERARALADFRVLVPRDPTLGRPDAVYESPVFGGGLVSMVYRPRPGFPGEPDGVGALIMEFRARVNGRELLVKSAGPGTRLRSVRIRGEPAFWISGQPHELVFVGPDGQLFPDSTRLSGSVLLWQHGDLVLRIEGAATEADALRVANSLR